MEDRSIEGIKQWWMHILSSNMPLCISRWEEEDAHLFLLPIDIWSVTRTLDKIGLWSTLAGLFLYLLGSPRERVSNPQASRGHIYLLVDHRGHTHPHNTYTIFSLTKWSVVFMRVILVPSCAKIWFSFLSYLILWVFWARGWGCCLWVAWTQDWT